MLSVKEIVASDSYRVDNEDVEKCSDNADKEHNYCEYYCEDPDCKGSVHVQKALNVE